MATLADPLACVLHALRPVNLDGEVLIIGDGPMAALAAVRSRQVDAQRVTVAVKHPDRIGKLAGFADEVVASADLAADRYDVVVETVGGISSEPILTAVTAVAPLGQVVALGVYHAQATADLSVRRFLEKEATLHGSKAYRITEEIDDFADALDLLAHHPGDFLPVITEVETLPTEVPQSFASERAHTLKVVYTRETTTR
ncbi:zinc-binding dehydrogenase [Nocardia sp. NBC_01730]|uniref:zinc-binding dehydrogenase n=1 Tax=Nocardia sp. NBC_01730 TaxID=2975998 RepID=UPI002E0D19BC|nr:zinc-binding dehydrogenase [Nocardia sp. NBC_01730]